MQLLRGARSYFLIFGLDQGFDTNLVNTVSLIISRNVSAPTLTPYPSSASGSASAFCFLLLPLLSLPLPLPLLPLPLPLPYYFLCNNDLYSSHPPRQRGARIGSGHSAADVVKWTKIYIRFSPTFRVYAKIFEAFYNE